MNNHILIGFDDKARKILKKLRSSDADIDKEMQSYRDLNELHQKTDVCRSLRQKNVLQRLGIVCGLFVMQVTSGGCVVVGVVVWVCGCGGSSVGVWMWR